MSRTNPENVGDDLLVEVERDVVGRAGARQVGGEKAGAHPGGLRLGLLPHRLQQTLWVEEEASRVVVSSLCRLCSSLGVHPPPSRPSCYSRGADYSFGAFGAKESFLRLLWLLFCEWVPVGGVRPPPPRLPLQP